MSIVGFLRFRMLVENYILTNRNNNACFFVNLPTDSVKEPNYLISLFFVLFIYTPLYVQKMTPHLMFNYWPIPGIVFHFVILHFSIVFVYSFVLLFQVLGKKKGLFHNKSFYLFVGTIVGVLGGSTNYFCWYRIMIPPLFNCLVALFMLIMFYAIIRYQLMDIRIIISRAVIFIISYLPLLIIPFVITYFGKTFLIQHFGENYWIVPALLSILLSFMGLFFYVYIQKKSEQHILKEEYQHERAIKNLAEQLVQFEKVEDLSIFLTKELKNIAALSNVALYLYDDLTNNVDDINALIHIVKEKKDLLLYEQLLQEHSDLAKTMKSLNAAVIIPIMEKDNILGILMIGEKNNGRMFTNIELMAFKVLAYQIALQLQSIQFVQTMRKQIQQKEAEKAANLENLIAGIAHNLKTPIMSSAGSVSIISELTKKMQESGVGDNYVDEINSWTSDIQENLDYMDDIMKQVRKHMTNAEAGGEHTCILKDIIEKVTILMSHELKTHNCTLSIQSIIDDTSLIKGNINDILQVLNVLISNAIDSYQRKGGEVRLLFSKEDERVKISVEDNGVGISSDVQNRIFNKMVTTKGKYGRGLGLYLLYPMVRGRLGGDIGFTSDQGKGSTFWITMDSVGEDE